MNLRDLIPQFGRSRRLIRAQDPFQKFRKEINSLIDRAFDDYTLTDIGHDGMNIDVCDKGKELEIKAELPGVSEDDIRINIQDGMLIISGEKKSEKKEEGKNYYMMERSYGSFFRSIPLPFQVKMDIVEAELENGILTIHIPKPKEIQGDTQSIKIKKKK